MAEITKKRQGEILKALFEELQQHEDGLAGKEAIAATEAKLHLSDFEKAEYPNRPGVVRFPKIVRFSTINPVKAGWLTKSGGIWSITDEGRRALIDFPDPEALYGEAIRLYKEWEAKQEPDEEEAGGGDALIAAASLEEAEESARNEIRSYLGSLNPYRFQTLVGNLIEAMGYHVVWIAPKGADGGLDLLAQSDPLGVEGPRIKGQVKRRADKTSEEELRSFLSLIEDSDRGVYISLAGFTRPASDLARRSARRITLIDGDALFDLWVEHYDSLTEAGREALPIRPVYFLDLD